MILKLKYFFVIIAIVLGFNSCSKDYSQEGTTVESKGGIAVFTFDGAPKSCSVAIPGRTYIAGTALDSTGSVIISLTVDSIGSYDIATDTLDGILFSNKGSFAVTGTQTIILNGTGVPTAGGSFTYTPANNGCSFSITVLPAAVTINNNTGGTLTCNISGVDSDFNNNVNAVSVGLSGLASMSITGSSATSTATFNISIGNSGPLTTGTYSVVTATNMTPMFCTINYTDASGNNWGGGVSGQTGTPFTVLITNISTTLVQGTFSGTLYSSNGTGGVSKAILNGQFSSPVH
jgi:hypothetical protein